MCSVSRDAFAHVMVLQAGGGRVAEGGVSLMRGGQGFAPAGFATEPQISDRPPLRVCEGEGRGQLY